MKKADGSSLENLQKEMLDLVYSSEDRSGQYEPKTEFYREMTRALYSEIIEGTFEKTYEYFKKHKMLQQWDEAFEKYLCSCPPKEISFDVTTAEFIPFIPGEEWLRELADYEHAWGLAWDAPERRGFLNSTLCLRVYEHDVVAWMESGSETPPAKELIALAIYRDLDTHEVKTLQIQPGVLDLLSQWQNGRTPRMSAEEIARLSGQPFLQVLKNLAPVLDLLHQEKILLQAGTA